MEDDFLVNSQDERMDIAPWVEIPFIPLPEQDSTSGGQFLDTAREINIGNSGDKVFRVDRDGLWLGAKAYADAPFKVSMLGAVIAESLTVLGGTITGALIQTSALATTGIKLDSTSFRGYDSLGNQTLTISATSGDLLIYSYDGASLGRITQIAGSSANVGISIQDNATASTGYKWTGPSSGNNTASREDVPAFYYLNENVDHGDGFTAKNRETGWDGKFFSVLNVATKNTPAFYIGTKGLSGILESQITSDGYLSFPAFHHYSEFEEEPAVLASTLIAKAFWAGSGTGGTQEIRAEGADGYLNDLTYIRLSTGAVANQSSILTAHRSVDLALVSRFEALLNHNATITTTEQHWGWKYDSTHYAYFRFDTDVHATKVYFSYNFGSGGTSVDIGVTMPTSEVFFKYTIQMYAGKMYVFVDDVLKSTISDTVPQYGKAYFYVDNKATASERTMDIDYVKWWYGRSKNL